MQLNELISASLNNVHLTARDIECKRQVLWLLGLKTNPFKKGRVGREIMVFVFKPPERLERLERHKPNLSFGDARRPPLPAG
ncbi:MAG: hypothetical protein LBJ14_03245 [Desulfarculales bacterium]|jgi:hypothetical protein|nr:hypothetical protein [Desulfarculales bacterium]